MKRNFLIKALLLTALSSLLGIAALFGGTGEKFTDVDKLPSTAQKFIKQYYATAPVVSVQKNIDSDKDYQVILKDGTTMQFLQNGKFKSISAPKGVTLPAGVLTMLPTAVGDYITANYPHMTITSIAVDGRGWNVGLSSSNNKLIFNKKGEYLGAKS